MSIRYKLYKLNVLLDRAWDSAWGTISMVAILIGAPALLGYLLAAAGISTVPAGVVGGVLLYAVFIEITAFPLTRWSAVKGSSILLPWLIVFAVMGAAIQSCP